MARDAEATRQRLLEAAAAEFAELGIAGARVAFKALTSPDLDVNEGCFRPLEVVLPEGTMLSAKPPSALGLWSIALPTVIDTILKALAPAVPHLVPAAHKGDMGGCSFFGFRDDGSRFLLMNIFGGGWGGRPNEDGEDAALYDTVHAVAMQLCPALGIS